MQVRVNSGTLRHSWSGHFVCLGGYIQPIAYWFFNLAVDWIRSAPWCSVWSPDWDCVLFWCLEHLWSWYAGGRWRHCYQIEFESTVPFWLSFDTLSSLILFWSRLVYIYIFFYVRSPKGCGLALRMEGGWFFCQSRKLGGARKIMCEFGSAVRFQIYWRSGNKSMHMYGSKYIDEEGEM